jgi:hypothetical protein
LAGNLVKPLLSLYGTEWRERGYGLWGAPAPTLHHLRPYAADPAPTTATQDTSTSTTSGQQLLFGLRLVSRIFEENQQSAIQTKIEHHFGGFFQQIKGRQPIRKKDSKQIVIPTSRRLDSFLYEAATNFELFSNIQDQK